MSAPLYSIEGTVIRGAHYGTVLGFPTANLDRNACAKAKGIPLGVYAGIATTHDEKRYRAGIVIGPLEKDVVPKIEAHLLDFSGDLYGRAMLLSLVSFLRPFEDFIDDADLKKQIASDIENIRKIISL